jgi:lauroyl/myristoyl acyltransferase
MGLAASFTDTFRKVALTAQRAGVRAIRALGTLLSVPMLNAVTWLPAAVWALIEFRTDRKAFRAWSRFPPKWHPHCALFTFVQTIGFAHARLVYLWPDRLTQPRWLKRCRLQAKFDLKKLLESDRPIIFVSLHFGPFRSLPYWLRAHGIPTTTLVGKPVSKQSAWIDRLSPPLNVPVLTCVEDMRSIRKSIIGRRRLLFLSDVGRGKLVPVPFEDDQIFWMATGAIRLAASTGALLVPCLITGNKGLWNFIIHFGSAVPAEHLQEKPDLPAAANHLFQEMLPVLRQHPEQCRHRLLHCITSSSIVTQPDTGLIGTPEPSPI